MARGINKVILIGNLGADPEVRYSTAGNGVCTFNVATTEAWTDKQSGQKQERTEWHRVKVFGKLAETCKEYLHKGSQVYIEGSLRTDKYTDKNGVERYSTDVVARNMQMLGGRGGGGEGGDYGGGYANRAHAPAPPARAPAPAAVGEAEASHAPADGFEDDEIPF